MTTTRVTVVGDVMLDVRCLLSGPIAPGDDTPARITGHAGGAGANTAAWLARLGVPVELIARVGDDDAGRTAGAELTAAGVDCRFGVDPARATGRVIVLVGPDGERTMVSDRGANAALRPADITLRPPDTTGLSGPGHLHLSGYVLLDQGSRAAGREALRAARAAGWTTSVDPQTAAGVTAVGAARFLGWVGGVDLLLPNEAECVALGGPDLLMQSVPAIAVTRGRAGAAWFSRSGQRHVAVRPTVGRGAGTTSRGDTPDGPDSSGDGDADSTGAGDAFNAGFLSAWLRGDAPERALTAGVAAGTAAAGRRGGRPGR